MRAIRFFLVLPIFLAAAHASAFRHEVKLTVVTSVTEDAALPNGGAWSSETSITSPVGGPDCPDGSNATGLSQGTVTQCRWSNLSAGTSTKGKSTTVRALVTTATGETFDISMSCTRLSGVCQEPKSGATYIAQLDDSPKYLGNYAPRRAYGPIKVRFAPDGKKPVTYSIIFAMRAGSKQSHPD